MSVAFDNAGERNTIVLREVEVIFGSTRQITSIAGRSAVDLGGIEYCEKALAVLLGNDPFIERFQRLPVKRQDACALVLFWCTAPCRESNEDAITHNSDPPQEALRERIRYRFCFSFSKCGPLRVEFMHE